MYCAEMAANHPRTMRIKLPGPGTAELRVLAPKTGRERALTWAEKGHLISLLLAATPAEENERAI